jgi:hypothetical protein
LNIFLVNTHKKSKTTDMGKEPVRLSLENHNVVWKRLSKGTNPPYEKKCTSLLALLALLHLDSEDGVRGKCWGCWTLTRTDFAANGKKNEDENYDLHCENWVD